MVSEREELRELVAKDQRRGLVPRWLLCPSVGGGRRQISSGEMVFRRAPVKPEREGAWP